MNKIKKKYFNVGIYLRLSDEDKNKINKDDPSESIKNQRHLLIEEIKKRDNFILIDEYCDEDLSGAGTFRPEFERLIRDCENGKIDVVLCKSQSRFSRDMEIVEKYIHNKFLEWNVRFIGLADNADTLNSGNKKSRQINGLVNEWYLEDVSNNIRSAFNAKMKQGEFISPFAPFGYEVSIYNSNKLIIDPIASEIVKDIYYLYLKGMGFTSIAKYLNNKNIPSPSLYKYQKGIKLNIVSNKPREDIKWCANAIKTILTNEVYIGHLVQGKRTTISYKNHKIKNKNKNEWIRKENTHQAIINKEIFTRVQSDIKKRARSIKKSNIVHKFCGKVFCLECSNYMRKKNSSKHEYLVCSKTQNGYSYCSNKNSIRYDLLEKIILDEINKKIQEYYDEFILIDELNRKKENKFTNKINILNKQKIEIENKICKTKLYLKTLYEDKVNGLINNKQFKQLIENYNKDEDYLKKQIKVIEKEIKFYKDRNIKNIKQIFSKYHQFKNLNKIIIDEFIEKIYIGKLNKQRNTRDIQIKWNLEKNKQ